MLSENKWPMFIYSHGTYDMEMQVFLDLTKKNLKEVGNFEICIRPCAEQGFVVRILISFK